jgi:predicted amidohydrolase YtcJ
MLRFYYLGIFALSILCACSSQKNLSPTLAVVNARIWTGNPNQPWAEAIAVNQEKIIYVGDNESCRKICQKSTQIIDNQQQMIVPGFIDSHVHFMDGGKGLTAVQLRNVTSKQEFIRRIAIFAKTLPKGAWITNGDWDQTLWGGELPEAQWIDSVTQQNPMFIYRGDGHMALANSLAMQLVPYKEIEGGEIVRNAEGKPTGIFKDNAQDIFYASIPDASNEFKDKYLAAAMDFVASKGVTSVQNMGTWDELATFRRNEAQKKLKTRIYAVVPLSSWKKLAEEVKIKGKGNAWVSIGGLKGFVDGSLGSHTAVMHQPFLDDASKKGLFVTPLDTLYQWISAADKAHLQVMVHAIGDKAITTQLDIYQRVIKENGAYDRRFRIEHAQHIAPADIARFGTLPVIPSMQPYHCIDDGRWAEKYIGLERAKTTYAFKTLLEKGAKIAFGSDWFVAPPTPLEGIYAAVTRRTLDDKNPNGWISEQKISVEDALRAYTIHAAYASFEEKIKGSLEVGKLPDFTILEKDITKIAPETIRNVKVIKTVVGGKIVFEQ